MWTFLNPMFLYALAAGAIPLILHLLKRQKSVVLHFSTLRFLKLAQKKSSRRLKMENFLLWLLRTLLLLLLALAFALPVIRTTSFGKLLGRSNRDVSIVWDVSASMEYQSGQKKTWDESRDVVLTILKSLLPGDRVTIFLAGSEVTPLIAEPSGDLDLATAKVKATQTKPQMAKLALAVTVACQSLQNSGKREREVYIVTDGQALSWRDFGGPNPNDATDSNANPTTPSASANWNPESWEKDYSFFVALTGPTAPANTGVLDVDVAPHLLMENSTASATVRIGQFGQTGDATLSLFIDDKESGRLAVNPAASDELTFPLPPLTRGTHRARIECQPDGYELDNSLHFLLRVQERLPVLVIGPEDSAFFIRRALNPGGDAAGSIDPQLVSPDNLQPGELKNFPCVILTDALPLPAPLLLALDQFAKSGGLLIVFPGDRAKPADYADAAFLPAKVDRIEETGDASLRSLLRLVQPQDAIFASLKFPAGVVPSVSIKRQIAWADSQPDTEVLVSTQGDKPFLQSRKIGQGRVLTFSVSADRKWSNLPLSPYFLPILHQMLEFGAGMRREPLYRFLTKDLVIAATTPGFTDVTSIRAPSGELVPVRTVPSDGGDMLRIEGLLQPGVYTVGEGTEQTPLLALNAQREESDLTVLKDDDAKRALGVDHVIVARDGAELVRMVDSHRKGRPMAELLLWLVALLSLVELFVANLTCKTAKKLTDSMTIELSGRVKVKAES